TARLVMITLPSEGAPPVTYTRSTEWASWALRVRQRSRRGASCTTSTSGASARTTSASADRSSPSPCTLYDMTRIDTSLETAGQVGRADHPRGVTEQRAPYLPGR